MRQVVVYAMIVLCLAAIGAWAAAEAPPQVAPEGKGSLPSGHPPIPQGGGLPPGHPPTAPGSGGMPQGHPPISGAGVSAPDPDAPPPDAKGTLIVQAVQGTSDGPVVKGDPVIVVLIHNDAPVKRVEANLDGKGQVVLENLPVGGGVQPLVTVKHGEVNYWGVGERMHAGPPDHRVTVMVYESTEEPPPYVFQMRHLFVRRTEEGLYVKEMLAVDNRGDKTWIGRKGADGKRVTVELALAPNTGRLDFYGGLTAEGTDFVDTRVVNRLPVLPGTVQYQFGYVLPVTGGKATLDIACPADTSQLILAVPDDGTKVSAMGLEAGATMPLGPQKLRLYKAMNVKAGQKVSALMTDIPDPPPPPKTK